MSSEKPNFIGRTYPIEKKDGTLVGYKIQMSVAEVTAMCDKFAEPADADGNRNITVKVMVGGAKPWSCVDDPNSEYNVKRRENAAKQAPQPQQQNDGLPF